MKRKAEYDRKWRSKQRKLAASHRKELISRIRERYGKHNH